MALQFVREVLEQFERRAFLLRLCGLGRLVGVAVRILAFGVAAVLAIPSEVLWAVPLAHVFHVVEAFLSSRWKARSSFSNCGSCFASVAEPRKTRCAFASPFTEVTIAASFIGKVTTEILYSFNSLRIREP
jgi:hypothetical protein